MSRWINLRVALLAALCGVGLCGCVERHYVIQSDPPGAIVFENGRQVGATPLDRSFPYYGTYRFTLVKDGYQTLVVDEPIKTPWYEYFPLDFFVENLWPFTVHDVRVINYKLAPPQLMPPEALLDRSGQLRQKAQGIGVPLNPTGLFDGPLPVPPPGTLQPPVSGAPVPPPPPFTPSSR